MRLLFDRDLTPHPQYAAFYRHLTHTFDADALVHFGMHGTVEWLPGSPLGNTGFSWSDVLMSNTPNMYIYAANNPSESIIAKRRGYGTIVSHNVPPYGRAGTVTVLPVTYLLVCQLLTFPTEGCCMCSLQRLLRLMYPCIASTSAKYGCRRLYNGMCVQACTSSS